MHPLADYAAKELKVVKRVITIADDFAFGHEQMAWFQRVFEDAGGRCRCDDTLMKSFGDEVLGVISCSAYTGDLDTPSNKRLVDGMVRDYGNIPGLYAAGLYINGMVAEAALEKTGGKTDDKEALNRALRAVSLTDTPRGPFSFDRFGNVIGSFYIRRCEKKGDKLVNTTIKTYPWARAAASGPRVSAAG